MDLLLKQYASLVETFATLENEREILRIQIVKAFKEKQIEKHNTEFGHFSLGHRSTYEYSDAVKKLSDKVKIAKHKEEVSGKAKEKVTDYLIFKVPGEEN
jgi:hypothetical protein